MDKSLKLSAVISRAEDMFVALCPELDVVSQGSSIEDAKVMLREAVGLYLECASEEELNIHQG